MTTVDAPFPLSGPPIADVSFTAIGIGVDTFAPTTTLPVTVEYGPIAMSATRSGAPSPGTLNVAFEPGSIVRRKNRRDAARFSTYTGYECGAVDTRKVTGAA